MKKLAKYALWTLLAIVAIVVIVALVRPNPQESYGAAGYDEAVNAPRESEHAPDAVYDKNELGSRGTVSDIEAQAGVTIERMVIQTGSISILVEDVEQTLPQVLDMVRGMEGYIVQSSTYRTHTDRLAAQITLRVPADRFDEALSQLRGLAWKVTREDVSGEDVTDQYVDLQSRLKTLQATEIELLALLTEVRESEGNAEEKANAILAIHEQLTNIRSQIEQIQGRMQYLEQMSAMATISVELTPRDPDIEQPVVEEGFDPGKIFRRAASNLVEILQNLLVVLINFVTIVLPLLLLLGLVFGLPIWLIVRWRRKKSEE
ncbi:MAG: DUF4349 domain-containing protein [Chloroflexia bacterium]|nr:DUF4349 domain-containing protein [Chloroflexia bacterium]